MINITKPYIGLTEYLRVFSVLASGNLSSGKYVQKLEKDFSEKFKAPFVYAVSNGTAALHLALLAAGIGPGDEVITTAFTFIATANAILMVGARPVFVDIDNTSYCIDPESIKSAITKNTKAIITVNLYGTPCDYDEIRNVLPKGVVIIEDAAQSVGSKYNGKFSGSLGDVATFSLYATKNIMSGEGGLVTTSSKEIGEMIMLLRQHGMYKENPYTYMFLGYNYRMSDLSASVAVSQLDRLDEISRKRCDISKLYDDNLSKIAGITLLDLPPNKQSSLHQYPVRVTSKAKLSRNSLKQSLLKKGIGSAIYYPDVLTNVEHLKTISVINKTPNASLASQEVLCLPIHPGLAQDDQWYIIDSINQLLR